jgi:hypothetical protein
MNISNTSTWRWLLPRWWACCALRRWLLRVLCAAGATAPFSPAIPAAARQHSQPNGPRRPSGGPQRLRRRAQRTSPALGKSRTAPALQAPRLPQLPNLHTFAYQLFHADPNRPYLGKGRGSRPAAPPVSGAERLSKLHCGCCRTQLSERHLPLKAVNKGGATYWVCGICATKLRARGVREWKCPAAAKGKSGCRCWCADAKKQQVCRGKRPKGKGWTSRKQRKWWARMLESDEGEDDIGEQ